MKKLLLAVLISLLPITALGQDTEPGGLDAASSVTATDDFVVDQGALVLKATALQIATYIKTHFNTEAKLEAIVADVTNILTAAELNTEAKLEALLGDVTNVITDSEASASTDSAGFDVIISGTNTAASMVVGSGAEIELEEGGEVESNEVIIFAQNETGATIYKCSAVHIHDFDIPSALPEVIVADSDDATKMPATGILYEDIADGASGRVMLSGILLGADTTTGESWAEGDRLYVNDSGTSTSADCAETLTSTRPANTDDSIQAVGTVVYTNPATGKVVVSGAGRSNDVPNLTDDYFWLGNATNVATAVQMSADATMANDGAVTIADGAIEESMLNASNAPTDEYYLTYEVDNTNFQWVASSGGGATSEGDLETALTDTTNVLTDNDASITFDAGIDLITSANGDIDLSPNGTGVINANSTLNTNASSTPTLVFLDDDGEDPDDNASISGNLTTIGTGAEYMDLSFKVQIAGSLTEVMAFDADGNISTSNLTFAPGVLDLPAESVLEVDLYSTDEAADGECLAYDAVGAGDFEWVACGSGGGAWSDASDPVVLNTTTKSVVIGTAQKNSSKLTVDGQADVVQATIQGHSTQTTNTELFIVEDSTGQDIFAVNDDTVDNIVVGAAGTTGTISGTGTYVEIDDVLYITPVASPPIACTTNAGIIYHDTSGTLCICDGASAWVLFADYSGGGGACS